MQRTICMQKTGIFFFFTNYYQFEGIKTKRSYTRRNEMAHIVQLTHYYYISK